MGGQVVGHILRGIGARLILLLAHIRREKPSCAWPRARRRVSPGMRAIAVTLGSSDVLGCDARQALSPQLIVFCIIVSEARHGLIGFGNAVLQIIVINKAAHA